MGVSPKTYLQLLTVERTAGILGVSAATVRNWVRCGRIVPAARRPVMLSRVDVLALKKDIRNHVVDKLRKCANKSNSRSFHTPHHSDFPAGIAKLSAAEHGRCGAVDSAGKGAESPRSCLPLYRISFASGANC